MVAVISVLAAVAVPTFSHQLEKARQAVDMSNLRGAYAAAKLAAMDGRIGGAPIDAEKTYYYDPDSGELKTSDAGLAYGKSVAEKVFADTSSLPDAARGFYASSLPTKDECIWVVFEAGGTVKSITFGDPSAPVDWTAEQASGIYKWSVSGASVTITGLQDGVDAASVTVMPDSIDGNPVTIIGTGAFQNCTNLALTKLPSGLKNINDKAFRGCTNLALKSLPDGVRRIGEYAFASCAKLALTSLSDGLERIYMNAFDGCTNLALTSLPDGVTSIDKCAFDGCTNLALTSLPSKVTSIGIWAFRNCTNVNITTVPCSYESSAFVGTQCTNPTVASS